MTPEDLIDTKVSKRLIVYCMREMNLRIPFNVDLSDIVPYEPPPIMPLRSDTPSSPEATEPSPTDPPTQPGQPPPPSTLPPPIPAHEVPPRPPDVVKPQPRQRRPTQSHAPYSPYNNQSDRAPHTVYPSPMGMNQSGSTTSFPSRRSVRLLWFEPSNQPKGPQRDSYEWLPTYYPTYTDAPPAHGNVNGSAHKLRGRLPNTIAYNYSSTFESPSTSFPPQSP
jgi:hypothetical protein